jgi:acyl-CoA reductase-like NAD-dependent aldehyde dehydrogenase
MWFVPALNCGQFSLYKPSEFATLTGIEIAKMLHASGVPEDVFAPVIGTGEVGADLVKQPSMPYFLRAPMVPDIKSPRLPANA